MFSVESLYLLYHKDSNMFRHFSKVKPCSARLVLGYEYPIHVAITYFSFFPSFSKAILRTAELPSLCYVVSSNYQLLVSRFAMAVFIHIIVRINKQQDKSFEFSSILSTVDLSKHLIIA